MKLAEILATYPDVTLDRLAADKIDEVANLRLPRAVLIEEICSALSSLSYVASALAPARPPTYSILKLLLEAPDHVRAVDGFRDAVDAETERLTAGAEAGSDLPAGKDYDLYLKILYAAWENDGRIDRSEALILAALRSELAIWPREHLLLEHHPTVRPLWAGERAFDDARNHLLVTGLVLTWEGSYVVADEVCRQLRQTWGIDLEDPAYRRLLDLLTVQELHEGLRAAGLPMSGSKEERIERMIAAMVPPAEVLDTLHINRVKELCRECGLIVTAAKAELITSLVEHFDSGGDLAAAEAAMAQAAAAVPPDPEPRELETDQARALLMELSLDQLHDILSKLDLAKYGTKGDRADRLLASPWSERTMLACLRRADLAATCRRLGVRISGVKDELIERLLEGAGGRAMDEALAAAELDAPMTPSRAAEHPVSEDDAAPPSPPAAPEEARSAVPTDVPAESPPVPPAAPPAGIRDIETDYPDVPFDERVILAVAKEARSLTELDVARLAEKHRLGWSLTKAHMADLLGRLSHNGASPLRVRSAGGINIYEWIGNGRSGPERISRDAARDVVDALRQGVVPERHLDLLVVGQDAARQHLLDLLEHVRRARSEFKFVRGPYGAGKTFLCSWLREKAFTQGFAVSTVRVGPDQPISDLPVFFAGLVNGLRTPEKRDSSALADILESWLLALHRKTAQLEGVSPQDPDARASLRPLVEQRINEQLGRLAEHDPGFGPAVAAFYRARLAGDQAMASTALAWLRGSSSVSADALRAIGVRGHLEPEQVFPRLRALLEVISTGRLQGLLLLVDELELVRRMPHARQREQSYETLRLLIDECGENDLPGCLLVCTGTDALFDDSRYGLASYEALANRISPPRATDGLRSIRQPVVTLEGLAEAGLGLVARRIREIHSEAYGWPAGERVPDVVLDRMVDEWTTFGGERVDRLPRPFLREVVHLLDLCEENPAVEAVDCLRRPDATTGAAAVIQDFEL